MGNEKNCQNINFFLLLKMTIILRVFTSISHILLPLLLFSTSLDLDLASVWIPMKNEKLFYYSVYFCYYLWVSLYFLVLFMSLTVLFQLTFTFIYSTYRKKKKIQFYQNKWIPNKSMVCLDTIYFVEDWKYYNKIIFK